MFNNLGCVILESPPRVAHHCGVDVSTLQELCSSRGEICLKRLNELTHDSSKTEDLKKIKNR